MSVELVYSMEDFERNSQTGEMSRTGQRYVLRFDATTREGHLAQSTLTEHAVERGASIADHKIPETRTFSLTCIVTDTPLGDPPPSGSRTREVRGTIEEIPLGDGTYVTGLEYSDTVTRTIDVLAELEELCARPIPVEVRTSMRIYSDMQIVSVSAPRTQHNGTSVEFTIEFRELRTSRVETTTAPRPRFPRNKGRANRGAQATQQPTEEQKKRTRSVLGSIFGVGDP